MQTSCSRPWGLEHLPHSSTCCGTRSFQGSDHPVPSAWHHGITSANSAWRTSLCPFTVFHHERCQISLNFELLEVALSLPPSFRPALSRPGLFRKALGHVQLTQPWPQFEPIRRLPFNLPDSTPPDCRQSSYLEIPLRQSWRHTVFFSLVWGAYVHPHSWGILPLLAI